MPMPQLQGVTQAAQQASNTAMSGASNMLQSGMQLIEIAIRAAIRDAEGKDQDRWENAKQDSTNSEFLLEQNYAVGLCGSAGTSPLPWSMHFS